MNPIKLLSEKIHNVSFCIIHYVSFCIMRLSIFIFKNKRTKMILYYNFNLFLIAIEIKPLLESHISSYEVMIATIC